MALNEIVCTDIDCIHNDGEQSCILEIVTIGDTGQCKDYEEDAK